MNFDLDLIGRVKSDLVKLPQEKFWQVPLEGALYLQKLIFDIRPRNVLEIGTSSGYSGLWIVESLLANEPGNPGHLITFESNQARYDFANQNFKTAGVETLITSIKGHAPKAFGFIPGDKKIDLAFIDGTKSQTTEFFIGLLPYFAENAQVVVDNVTSTRHNHHLKMQPFLDYLAANNYKFEVVEVGDGFCHVWL
jgi:predicted O-methyltransferase YrrM